LSAAHDRQDVEQENEQIVGVSRFGRKRFLVDQFKVNQPSASSLLIVDNVGHAGIAVRPWAGKFIAPALMSPAEFAAGCFQHPPSQCATIHVVPQALTRQLVHINFLCA